MFQRYVSYPFASFGREFPQISFLVQGSVVVIAGRILTRLISTEEESQAIASVASIEISCLVMLFGSHELI